MLDVQDELLHALPATFVNDWLEASRLALMQCTCFFIDAVRSVSFDGIDA